MMFSDEDTLYYILQENKRNNLQQSEKFVACNLSDKGVNSFHLVMSF